MAELTHMPPVLAVIGGLPGVGKTTIARRLVRCLGAMYLRIDSIEQAMIQAGMTAGMIGSAGYAVANALADANLRLGRDVVADCVNPVRESRDAWRVIATDTGAFFIDCEIVCTDVTLHRHRVESRTADIGGHRLPKWADVESMRYEKRKALDLVIDTARQTPAVAAQRIMDSIIAIKTGSSSGNRGTA